MGEMSVHWRNGSKRLCPCSVPAAVRNCLCQDVSTDDGTGDWVSLKSHFPVQEPVIQTNVQNPSKGNICLRTRPPRKRVHMDKYTQTLLMCLHGIIPTISPISSYISRKWKTQSSYFPQLCLKRQHNYNLVCSSEISAPTAPGFVRPLLSWLHCDSQRGKCRFREKGRGWGDQEQQCAQEHCPQLRQRCTAPPLALGLHLVMDKMNVVRWLVSRTVHLSSSFHHIPFCSTR